MIDLSPAAQAVLDAACIYHGLFNEEIVQRRRMVAAALCAAADQVVPGEPVEAFTFTNEAIRLNRMGIRADLYALAAELECAS